MSKQPLNFQDSFLNQVRKENQEIKIVMMNGASIIGVVRGFDNFTLLLQSRNAQHLLYKHAIAQMISRKQDSRRSSSDGTSDSSSASSRSGQSRDEGTRDKDKRGGGFNQIDLSHIEAPENATPSK